MRLLDMLTGSQGRAESVFGTNPAPPGGQIAGKRTEAGWREIFTQALTMAGLDAGQGISFADCTAGPRGVTPEKMLEGTAVSLAPPLELPQKEVSPSETGRSGPVAFSEFAVSGMAFLLAGSQGVPRELPAQPVITGEEIELPAKLQVVTVSEPEVEVEAEPASLLSGGKPSAKQGANEPAPGQAFDSRTETDLLKQADVHGASPRREGNVPIGALDRGVAAPRNVNWSETKHASLSFAQAFSGEPAGQPDAKGYIAGAAAGAVSQTKGLPKRVPEDFPGREFPHRENNLFEAKNNIVSEAREHIQLAPQENTTLKTRDNTPVGTGEPVLIEVGNTVLIEAEESVPVAGQAVPLGSQVETVKRGFSRLMQVAGTDSEAIPGEPLGSTKNIPKLGSQPARHVPSEGTLIDLPSAGNYPQRAEKATRPGKMDHVQLLPGGTPAELEDSGPAVLHGNPEADRVKEKQHKSPAEAKVIRLKPTTGSEGLKKPKVTRPVEVALGESRPEPTAGSKQTHPSPARAKQESTRLATMLDPRDETPPQEGSRSADVNSPVGSVKSPARSVNSPEEGALGVNRAEAPAKVEPKIQEAFAPAGDMEDTPRGKEFLEPPKPGFNTGSRLKEEPLSSRSIEDRVAFEPGLLLGRQGISVPETQTRAEGVHVAELSERLVDMIDKLVADLRTSSDGDYAEMRISLKPDHLGELHIKVAVERGALTAQFAAENSRVKALLESGFGQLRQNLQDSGLSLAQLSVSVGHHQHREAPQGQGSWNPVRYPTFRSEGLPAGDTHAAVRYHLGTVDLLA